MQSYLRGNPPRRNPISNPRRQNPGGSNFFGGLRDGGIKGGPWMPSTFPGGRGGGGFYKPGGPRPGGRPGGGGQGGNQGGGNQGGGQQGGGNNGGGSPFDPTNLDQIINGTGDYADLMRKLGLPLDPQFLAQRTLLTNQRDMGLQDLLNRFNVGNAQLSEQSLLGNRAIDENVAARGLYGSGIERRDERLLGNQVAQGRFGLQSDYSQGQLGLQSDYRGQMMQAMMDLANRLQGQPNLPLPNTGPWDIGMGGGGSAGGGGGGRPRQGGGRPRGGGGGGRPRRPGGRR